LNVGVDLVFFDGEEGEEDQGGNYTNWKPLGSNYFAQNLNEIYGDKKPVSGLVLDMVCDKDLKILMEQSSVEKAPVQTKAFWDIARKVNKNVFVNRVGSKIGDDHDPLNQAGIPTFLVIDPDYPPFHTTNDTLDKCSAESLETVAEAVVQYLRSLM
jgi:glutaminyl-peptide cyclotransferase